MADIRLQGVSKVFGNKTVAVRDLTLTFPSGSVTCLLGPSGCGKTTLMRIIAGLEEATTGDIYFDDDRVTLLSPSQRNIGMVFQYPVVYRGISVFRNIELPLMQDKSLSPSDRKRRVEEVLDTLDLAHAAQRDVSQLDNGTRQKVAVAREVVRQPRIILFDEPVTNVDVQSKTQLKRALKRLVKQHNQTIIYVTHDQTEAMTLADEIALMRDGEIVQRGVPRDIYNHPNDRFGGWFLGNPGMNFVPYSLAARAGGLQLIGALFAVPPTVEGVGAGRVVVGIRPERVRVYSSGNGHTVSAGIVRRAVVVGGQVLLTLRLSDGAILKAKVPDSGGLTEGGVAHVEIPLEEVTLFDADGHRLHARFVS
jgi:ABC-type sugar transport system ATPase subunit